MNKFLKLTILILAFLLLFTAAFFFFKGLTGRVVLDNNKNETNATEDNTQENETYNRDINTFEVTNKTPENLNEGECTLLEDGRKLCFVKRKAKINAGEVSE